MNSTIKYAVFSILLIFTITSCSIQKRIHRKGYSVDWKKNSSASVAKEFQINNNPVLEQKQDDIIEEPFIASAETKISEKDYSKKKLYLDGIIFKDTVLQRQDTTKTTDTTEYFDPDEKINNKSRPKTNRKSIIALLFSLFFFLLIPAIPALILGKMSLSEISNNPEGYKNKWMAKLSTVLGYVGCVIGLIWGLIAITASLSLIWMPLIFLSALVASVLIKNNHLYENKIDENKIQTNVNGVVAFILGLLSIFMIPAFFAVIFGAIAKRQINRNPAKYKNKWMATVGMVIGYIVLGLIFLYLLLFGLVATIWLGTPIYILFSIIPLIPIIISIIIMVSK